MANVDFTDIYDSREFIDNIKKKYIPELNDEELEMGIFGYLGDIHANILQNSAQTAAENALEGLPTKAKYIKNLYTHAHSLGIDVLATPAVMQVVLVLPEESLDSNLDHKNQFILDKEFPIMIEDLEFHLDYDIIIKKIHLPGREVAYSAIYDMTNKNPMSNIINPYLPTVGRFRVDNINVLMLTTQVRQIIYESRKQQVLTSNPLQNKSFTFEFENKLAGFDIDVVEGSDTYHLRSVYDGLIDQSGEKYINYLYLKENLIRCIFKRESYQPRINCQITINIYTTKGSEGNFKKYEGNLSYVLTSKRFNYNSNMWIIIQPLSDSTGGEDMKSSNDLRKAIPVEMLSRGTITNTRDLENFFNSINTDGRKIYFMKKLDSLERLYYSYVSLKKNNNILPTNTIDLDLRREDFDHIQNYNYVFSTGNCIYYRRNMNGEVITSYLNDEEKMNHYKSTGFLYFNPFLMIINKNPLYISYLVDIIDCYKTLNFSYINQNSFLQFIANEIRWKREYFTDRNKYKLTISLTKNIGESQLRASKFELYTYSSNGTAITINLKVIAVLKAKDGTPLRYTYGKITNESNGKVDCEFEFETDNTMDREMRLKLKDLYDSGNITKSSGYFTQDLPIDIYICPKLGDDIGGKEEIGYICPDLAGYCCCNKYSVIGDVPLYYDYSNVISTFVNVEQRNDESIIYFIKKMPAVRYDYMNSEEKIQNLIDELQLVKTYIEYKLSTLEDSFGVDIKLFNTYGPAKYYAIDDGTMLDNVSLKLNFKVKLMSSADDNVIEDMKQFIKTKVEDYGNIGNLHIPNLQAALTKQFFEQIEYIEFTGFNDYNQTIQHIYRDEFESDITKVPEILSINTLDTEEPDINIEIQSV